MLELSISSGCKYFSSKKIKIRWQIVKKINAAVSKNDRLQNPTFYSEQTKPIKAFHGTWMEGTLQELRVQLSLHRTSSGVPPAPLWWEMSEIPLKMLIASSPFSLGCSPVSFPHSSSRVHQVPTAPTREIIKEWIFNLNQTSVMSRLVWGINW